MLARFLAVFLLTLSPALPVSAQNEGLPERQMERMLEKLDQPGTWQNVPGPSMQQQPAMQQQSMTTQFGYPQPQQQAYQQPQGYPGYAQAPQQPYANPAFQRPTMRPMFAPAQGGFNQPRQAMFPAFSQPAQVAAPAQGPLGMTKGDLFRMFFGGNAAGTSTSQTQAQQNAKNASNQQKLYNAREYLQTANDQASRARNAAASASYGNDKWSKKNYADTAYYAAQAARAAANNATSAAAGGSADAQSVAAQARDAADRAQADADRARASADSSW